MEQVIRVMRSSCRTEDADATNAKSGKLITESRRRQPAREFRKFLDILHARVPATLDI